MSSRSPVRLGHAVVAPVAALLLAACGTSVVGGTPAAQGQSAPTAPAAGAPAATGAAIDACSFFDAAEVEKLVGSSPAGQAQTTPNGGSTCSWEDQTTYFSLTVEVGDPDTAINGTLPEWDTSLGPERVLPGGMRDINGAIQFVCGGTRQCSVQVVKEIQGDADQKAGIGLVPKIREKVGG